MGCFDSILLPCPKCGHKEEAQTKSGACAMREYTLENAPISVLAGVNTWAPFTCKKCKTKFFVHFEHREPEIREFTDSEEEKFEIEYGEQ